MIQRVTAVLAAMTLAVVPAIAQNAEKTEDVTATAADVADDAIPFDTDLSASVTKSAGSGSTSSISQGLWIEVTSDNTSLIRDIATSKKSGYEFDKSEFKSLGNWWFWGDINPLFHLDAEISVWDFDKVLYKANSYGANVPTVTWGDGLQTLAKMFFSPIYYGSDSGVGAFNKLGFNVTTPYVNAHLGYGQVKANGMSKFTGIYNILDRWDDVGNGFVELTNGKSVQNFGKVKVNALAALSLMRASFGTYDILEVNYDDKVDAALTFGSTSTSSELFRYNEQNDNAASAYVSFAPLDMFKFEVHGLTYFGTSASYAAATNAAIAGRITFTKGAITTNVMESYAGENVLSVWGKDSTINPDTSTSQANFWWDVNNTVGFGFDEGFTMNDVSALPDGLWTLRNEPMVDVHLDELLGKEVGTALYGVLNVDRVALADSADRPWVPYLEEAGIEVTANDLFVKKIVADYAAYLTYNDWNSTDGKAYKMFYNSIMLNADINDDLSVHAGSIIRMPNVEDETVVPFAVAVGASIKTGLPGKPKFWTHFTYGMNPYEYYNYSLYRYDDPANAITHRSYRLNCTDKTTDNTTSRVSFGLIWDLK
jgi:hypothetical protein